MSEDNATVEPLPHPARVRAVLFDLDGTLLDHAGAASDALHAWLPTVGVEATAQSLEQWFRAEEHHLARWRAGALTWAEQRRSRLRDLLPGATSRTADELDAAFQAYLRAYEAAWRAFPDVDAALVLLARRHLRLGVLTNGSSAQQQAKLAALGLSDAFEFVLCADELGTSKPDPRAYLAACGRFRLHPAQVLHVGDVPDLDVHAPRTAGLQALLIDRSSRHREPDSLRTLLQLADRIGR